MEGPVGIASPPSTWTLDAAYAYATQRAVPPADPDGEPLYNCPFPPCSKQFSKRFNLKAHLRVHTGDKPFVCPFPGCTRRFMWKSSLTSHQTGHSRRKLELQKRNAVLAGKALAAESVHNAAAMPLRAASYPLSGKAFRQQHRLERHQQHHSIMSNPHHSATTTQLLGAHHPITNNPTHLPRLPTQSEPAPSNSTSFRHHHPPNSSSHPHNLPQPPPRPSRPPSNHITDTQPPVISSHPAAMYSSMDCSPAAPRPQPPTPSSHPQPTQPPTSRDNHSSSDPSSMSYITAEYSPADPIPTSNAPPTHPRHEPPSQPRPQQQVFPTHRHASHPAHSHPQHPSSHQPSHRPLHQPSRAQQSAPMQLQHTLPRPSHPPNTPFRGSAQDAQALRTSAPLPSHPSPADPHISAPSPFHHAPPPQPPAQQQPTHSAQMQSQTLSGRPLSMGQNVHAAPHGTPTEPQALHRVAAQGPTPVGQQGCSAAAQGLGHGGGNAHRESLVAQRSSFGGSRSFGQEQSSGAFRVGQQTGEKIGRGVGEGEKGGVERQQLEQERLLEEQRLRLRRQEEQIKEQQRIIRQQEEKHQAQQRQLLRLQQEKEEMNRQDVEERQRLLPQARQDSKSLFGEQKHLRGVRPITEHQTDVQMTLPKLDESQRFQQRSIPSLPSPVQAGAVPGTGQEADRLGKRDVSGVLSKSTQPTLMSPASLGLATNSIIPSPSVSLGMRSPNGFHQQFLFPSNGSSTWGGSTPTVPGVPSMLMTSPKPPQTPNSQMDVQMANPGLDRHPGDLSPGPSEIAVSPGIVTSPVPPPILPEVSSTYRPRHALNRSKPPLGGPILSSGSSHTLSRSANAAPANPPTHIELKGLPEDEASCSLPALGSPHTELSPLPVASPIFGNGQTPVSPIQPYSPFSGLNSSSAKGKQTTTW